MSNDFGSKIKVDIQSAPYLLDEGPKSNNRIVLGYLSSVYEFDADATVTIFFRRNELMQWESLSPITLSKDVKRFFQKLPLIGEVIDFYIQLTGEFINFTLTSLKVSKKELPVGKFG
jgi:hypothetical protein